MKEKQNDVLQEYVKRLKKEALLKAILSALGVSFAVVLITALACWFTEFGGYWILAVVFALSFGAAFPLFYFFAFYPSEKYVAKRLDQLGLQERILTMVEFGNQDSYIMQRQREDAVASLKKLDSKLVKLMVSASIIAVAAVGIAAGTAMTTVYALSEAEVIPSGKELVASLKEDKTKFELVYKIPETQKDFGVLYSASSPEGADQITLTVGRGADGESILPIAAKGYVFRGWSDGMGNVIRKDTAVQGRIIVTAIFEELDLDFGDDNATDEEGPRGLASGDGNGDGRSPSNPNPDDNRDPTLPPNESSAGSGADGSGKVFDGKTDYGGETYKGAQETSTSELTQSGGADSDSKQIASDYMEAIKTK